MDGFYHSQGAIGGIYLYQAYLGVSAEGHDIACRVGIEAEVVSHSDVGHAQGEVAKAARQA